MVVFISNTDLGQIAVPVSSLLPNWHGAFLLHKKKKGWEAKAFMKNLFRVVLLGNSEDGFYNRFKKKRVLLSKLLLLKCSALGTVPKSKSSHSTCLEIGGKCGC